MQFGSNKGKPLLQFVACKSSVGWRQMLGWDLISDVLNNRRTFTQLAAIVEHEKGYIAERIDRVVIGAVSEFVGFGGGSNSFKGQTGLLECNVN